jgi:hypothetical protein
MQPSCSRLTSRYCLSAAIAIALDKAIVGVPDRAPVTVVLAGDQGPMPSQQGVRVTIELISVSARRPSFFGLRGQADALIVSEPDPPGPTS